MLNSTIESQSRLLANDTDATNPFVTQANVYLLIDDALSDLAAYLKWPRLQQTISFAQGDGPNGVGGITNAKNLNEDVMSILSVYLENTTTGLTQRLKPRSENELQALNNNWRYQTGQGIPSYYVIIEPPTVDVVDFPRQTLTVDMPLSEARTMRIHYVSAPTTGGSANAGNSCIFLPQFHKAIVYYVAGQMLIPRNAQKSQFFMGLYSREIAKNKSLMPENLDPSIEIWDCYQMPGYLQSSVIIR